MPTDCQGRRKLIGVGPPSDVADFWHDCALQQIGNNNCYLVKNKQSGGNLFSRDPLNLTNKHSRKHAGFVNDKVGILAALPNRFCVKRQTIGQRMARLRGSRASERNMSDEYWC